MTLNFMKKFPSGEPTHFTDKIIKSMWMHHAKEMNQFALEMGDPPDGLFTCNTPAQINKLNPKIHTIRVDKHNRWKKNNDIHFKIWLGAPYKSKTYQFAPLLKCLCAQKIEIKYNPGGGVNVFIDDIFFHYQTSWGLEWSMATKIKMKHLAINDGFDSIDSFFKYFNDDFTGKIIHWTDLKY